MSFTRVTEGRSSAIVRLWGRKKATSTRFVGARDSPSLGRRSEATGYLFGPPGINKKRQSRRAIEQGSRLARFNLRTPYYSGRTRGISMRNDVAVLAVACALVIAAAPQPAAAEGALAFALPRDTAKDGFAFGVANDRPTRADAEAEAMRRCHDFRDASRETRALCRIVASYSGRCVAVAYDPRTGVTGEGWAVETTLEAAQAIALDRCRATASRSRGQFCRVSYSYCDRAGADAGASAIPGR